MEVREAPTGSGAASRYENLTSDRQVYLNRAWECAELTIPSLLPRNGIRDQELPTPFQNVGATGVNNLSSKSLITLFPPNTPFFKLMLDDKLLREVEAMDAADPSKNEKTKYDKALSTIERTIQSEIEMSADRVGLYEALKHIYVTGNCLVFKDEKADTLRVFHLNRYVVRRDPSGHVMEIIVKEEVDKSTLSAGIQEQIQGIANEKDAARRTVDLYTVITRTDNKWIVFQECGGIKLDEGAGEYPLDKSPWIVLRFTKIDGENYGRSYVEEYLGDFRSLENLTAAIVQGSAAAAKVLFLVKPNSSTKVKVLAEAPNGAIRTGNAEDVTVLRLDKAQDFQTAANLCTQFESRLKAAFMIREQRDAERVTAEEVQLDAQQLETILGGFYSVLSVELQLPYVRVVMDLLSRKGRLPALPKGAVRPSIVTGLQGLGRGQDRNKLVAFLTTLTETLTPQIAQLYVNFSEVITRLATADGIDIQGLIKTDEEVQQAQQQQQMMEMATKLGGPAINAIGGASKERIKQDGQQAGQPSAGSQPTS